ncbi:MAG: ATP synthase F1 subunit delta [Lachnospiraceae bacterium]|nr:ATP synthase F1 subunit delta [Lachnospiraceae bacterium]
MTQKARIYGDSLYELAVAEHLTEPILTQAREVGALLAENPDYRRLLAEPSIPMAERVGLLDQAFSGTIERYLLNFLKILCEHGMLGEWEGCLAQYQERYDRDHGIARATVTSAVALTIAQAQALKERLEQMCGKNVILTRKVQPSLIGGMRIELEGKMIDGTVAGRMSGLQKKIKENLN